MMKDTKKAVPVFQHQDGKAETGQFRRPRHISTISLPHPRRRVKGFLITFALVEKTRYH